MTVSILVATYNCEQTLCKCLDSLLCQTHKDIQIICIDDASSDGTTALLTRYEQQHDCIETIFLKENHGQGYARNMGIPLIKGQYTTFLDSDDWYSPDALEKAIAVFNDNPQTDCVLFDIRYVKSNGKQESFRTPPFVVMSGMEAFRKALKWDIHGIYMAKSELYRQHPYDGSLHSYGDDNITMVHYYHSHEVRCCEGIYFIRENDASCTRSISIHRFDWLLANEKMHNTLLQLNVDKETINVYERERWFNYLACHRTLLQHKECFNEDETLRIKELLHRIWQGIDTSILPMKEWIRPGYMPLHPFWKLFCIQEMLFVWARKVLGFKATY